MPSSRPVPSFPLLLLALGAFLLPAGSRAAIAVLADGRTMKVAAWEVGEEKARLTLPGGGTVEIPAARLERIVDDEIVPDLPGSEDDAPIAAPPDDGSLFRFRSGATVLFSSRFDEWIVGLAARHDLDPGLVSALVKAESGFQPSALSAKGAAGLMQLMPATALRFGVSNRFDPVSSLDGGMRYLRWLADRYDGDAVRVLAAYNAGEGNVDRWGGLPPFRETKAYVRKILGWLSTGERKVVEVAEIAPRRR